MSLHELQLKSESNCTHEYNFIGLAWHYGDQCPGSGAHKVIYEDIFVCKNCLKYMYKNSREIGDSYTKRLEGSFPK
jgi:hypothetical protein